MVWYHYSSDNTLTLKSLIDLSCQGHKSYPYKPSGLWLSLDNEWHELQTDIGNKKFIEKLKYKYEVKIRDEFHPKARDKTHPKSGNNHPRLLTISSLEELNAFNEKYKVNLEDVDNDKEHYDIYNDDFGVLFPYWEKVCEDYDGMICLNYSEIFRQMLEENDERMPWWHWLDINCACIWRPSKLVKEITLS